MADEDAENVRVSASTGAFGTNSEGASGAVERRDDALPATHGAFIGAYVEECTEAANRETDDMARAAKVTRVDDAYGRLKEEILENRMPPGYQGPEPEIALRLGMSRTPVREALIRLQGEGLVELVPRRGVRVLPVSPSDMRDIYRLLTVLEPEAAADVADAGPDADQIAALEAATSEMEQALRDDDLDRWAAADDRFHRQLLGYNRNSRLTAFVNTLFDQAHRARIVTLHLRETPWKSTQEHRAILKAIAGSDPEETRRVFRAHRERAAAELIDVLERSRLSQL